MTVWILVSAHKGVSRDHVTAYTDEVVARARAASINEDQWQFELELVDGEEISGDRCIVAGRVCQLIKMTAAEMHRLRGLDKLSDDERRVLNLPTRDQEASEAKQGEDH